MKHEIAVSLATLKSKEHEINSIRSGTKIYNSGKVEFEEQEPGRFVVAAEDNSGRRGGVIVFTKDGFDIDKFVCNCASSNFGSILCKHIVAGVLAIQGGIIDTYITYGKMATAETVVTDNNTAKAVGSGSLDVFATPMMIALMEQAACNVLSGALKDEQTSVGANINVHHAAPSPIGRKITAMAVIDSVSGRTIKFVVSASDDNGEIGIGMHTRVIVDKEPFVSKMSAAKKSEV